MAAAFAAALVVPTPLFAGASAAVGQEASALGVEQPRARALTTGAAAMAAVHVAGVEGVVVAGAEYER